MINTSYSVAMADGGGRVSSAGAADAAASARSTGESSGPRDASNISSFSSVGADFDMEGDMNALYAEKAQVEGELGELKGQRDEAQSKVNERRQELTKKNSSTNAEKEVDKQLEAYQKGYNEQLQAKNQAQQDLNAVNQKCSANDQAINSNAQQTQQTSADLSSAQSQLSSLTPPSKPGGDDKNGQADYQAQMSAYNQQKAALERRISQLQQTLQRLQTEGQRLQNEKVQLSREKDAKQREVSQLETNVQALQQVIDGIQQKRADEDYKLRDNLENDGQLQNLQSKLDDLDGKVAAKETKLGELEAKIAEAEAKNSGLQAAREQDVDQDFQESARDMGFNVSQAESRAQNNAARERYGKNYSELTEEEKLSIEASVDGEVTLAAMQRAEEILEDDPDNVAAQMVLERGAKNLDAQERLARANLYGSLDNIPAGLQDGAAQAMEEARRNAPAGTDPEIAAMQALSDYITDNVDEAEYSDEELAALDDILGNAGDYMDSRETAFRGADVLDDAAVYLEKSDMYAMRVQLAAEQGVDPDQIVVLSGTDKNDNIEIYNGDDGGLCIVIGDQVLNYTKEQAQLLIIDGGAGNDTIWADYDVTQDLHIYGGAGDDKIYGGQGNDLIGGGAGKDKLFGYDGSDTMLGGSGDDEIDGGWGDDYIFGGAGKDKIQGGYGNDVLDGGDGDDTVEGGAGNDIINGGDGKDILKGGDGEDMISGGKGNDEIYGGKGSDYIDAGDGDDYIEGNGGDDYIKGGAGKDKIYGHGGHDIISGGSGDDYINGGDGNDFLLGESGNDTIEGRDGDDTISGGYGSDTIDGGDGCDTISGGAGNDDIEGGWGNDVIYGNGGNDFIGGGWGDDTIVGGAGVDSIYGEQGFDTLYGESADEEVNYAPMFRKENVFMDVQPPEEINLDGFQIDKMLDVSNPDTAGIILELGGNADAFAQAMKEGKFGAKMKINDATAARFAQWAGKAAIAGGILGTFSGAVNVVDGLRRGDAMQTVAGVGSFAAGTSALTSGTAISSSKTLANMYKSAKISSDALKNYSNIAGGIGGAVTAFTGILDACDGFGDGDKVAGISGIFEAASGTAAVIAACCPAAAPVCLVISGVCILIHFGIDLFNPNA